MLRNIALEGLFRLAELRFEMCAQNRLTRVYYHTHLVAALHPEGHITLMRGFDYGHGTIPLSDFADINIPNPAERKTWAQEGALAIQNGLVGMVFFNIAHPQGIILRVLLAKQKLLPTTNGEAIPLEKLLRQLSGESLQAFA